MSHLIPFLFIRKIRYLVLFFLFSFLFSCNEKTPNDIKQAKRELDSLQELVKDKSHRIRYLESKISVLKDPVNQKIDAPDIDPVEVDLKEIKEKGKLTAITSYSSTSYFIYRGQPMGYEYELLRKLADHLGVKLEIKVAYNLNQFFQMLNNGEGDIVAHNLTVTNSRQKKVNFTNHHSLTRQVLVQRKPRTLKDLAPHEIEDSLIQKTPELIGKTIHVREATSYYRRLVHLSEEIGGKINIKTLSGENETSDIIEKVATGEINYTIADQHIAEINATYYDNIDINTPVSFSQRLAWAVRKTSPHLEKAVNQWIDSMKQESDYYVLHNKYFKNSKGYRDRLESPYFSKKGGKISPYDDILKKYAANINWDWRLLASQAFQESTFNPKAVSWAGAKGLMQLMPRTAQELGNYNLFVPEQSVAAGTKYLAYLENLYQEIPEEERTKFILAAYNAGLGHVADSRRLAKKYGYDPNKWNNNVEKWILRKSHKKYYRDKVVKYGYCRGEEPVQYVRKIMNRFESYKKFIQQKEAKEDGGSETNA